MSVDKHVSEVRLTPEGPTGAASTAVAAGDDLSRAVELAVPRLPGDRVKCARVFETYYRCNWWSAAAGEAGGDGSHPGWSPTSLHRVRKSRFLRVTSGTTGLSMEEVAGEEPRGGE